MEATDSSGTLKAAELCHRTSQHSHLQDVILLQILIFYVKHDNVCWEQAYLNVSRTEFHIFHLFLDMKIEVRRSTVHFL
jgi:hypothetical protein